MALDRIDRRMLMALQDNARISNTDLAEKVNLTPTPCLRRLRQLEQRGYISSYATILNQKSVGLSITAFASIKLERNSEKNARIFERAMDKIADVMECWVMTGEYDYLLKIVAADLESYERILKEKLAAVTVVDSIHSSIALNQVTHRTALPLL